MAAFLGLICILLFLSANVHAQEAFGSVVGTVTDASGNVVVGATVTLTNVGTAGKQMMNTNGAGDYDFVNLVPGNYRIDVEDTGFKHFTRLNVDVQVQGSTRVDAVLAIGEASQTVEVTSQTPLLETQQATVGQVVAGRSVMDMPLNGRMVFNLLALTPGVVPEGGTSSAASNAASGSEGNGFSQGNYQISGGVPNTEAVFLDGAPINNGYINAVAFVPSQDSVQEFRIEANNIGPEFGGTEDGVMTMITKSGANAFHGDGDDFLRNTVLNANTFYGDRARTKKPVFIQNQFDAALGGPIKRNKMFFYFNYEGVRAAIGSTTAYSVPTYTTDGGGDITVNNVTTPITDPGYWTTTSCTAGAAGCPESDENSVFTAAPAGTTFSNYTIPANRINPTAKALLQLWPAPQNPASTINNYTVNTTVHPALNQYTARIDWNLSSKQRVFGRYTYSKFLQINAPPYGVTSGLIAQNYTLARNNVNSVAMGDNITLSSATVMNLTFTFFRNVGWSGGADIPANIGFVGWPATTVGELVNPVLPRITVSGLSVNGGGAQYIPVTDENFAGAGSVTKMLGRHTLLFGGEWRAAPNNYGQTNSTNVETFNFTNDFSNQPFVNFLLGIPQATITENVLIPADMMHYWAVYAGDTYNASGKLTLNLGIRWEYPGYWTERHDRQAVFLPNQANPLASQTSLTLPGNVVLVNTPSYPRRTNEIPHYNAVSPRVGAEYRITNKLVVRGGFGIIMAPTAEIQQDAQPYQSAINLGFTTLAATTTPNNALDNPFPTGVLPPVGRSPNYQNVIEGQSVDTTIPNEPLTYVAQWNVNVERDLGSNTMVQGAYVASHGYNQLGPAGLNDQGRGIDQLPDQYDSMGSALLTPTPNPFYGLITSGNLSGPTIPAGQLLRPYPQYFNLYNAADENYFEEYRSLQITVQKRFANGGTLLGDYTWGRNYGNADTQTGYTEGVQPGETQDYTDLAAEVSQISYNVPQRAVISYVLDLPLGQGQRFFGKASGPINRAISGWGMDGITTFQSGFPVVLTAQPTILSSQFGAGAPRPNYVAGCDKSVGGSAFSRTLPGQTWFNTACFTQPDNYSFGNEPRSDPALREEGIDNWDVSFFKRTEIAEGLGLEFRAEFFNLFNRVQFGYPSSLCCRTPGAVSNASFGVISSTLNNPRQVQFALRLTY
jgi:hypothetical protein